MQLKTSSPSPANFITMDTSLFCSKVSNCYVPRKKQRVFNENIKEVRNFSSVLLISNFNPFVCVRPLQGVQALTSEPKSISISLVLCWSYIAFSLFPFVPPPCSTAGYP